ncbi:MAG: hypothetical protein QOD77_1468 [Thermoplasmata archaeon]|jgi:hypothetical protein|nr:hypothetical protein [Thermoplasmata archaeon]
MQSRSLLATAALALLLAAAAMPGAAQSPAATTGVASFEVSVAYIDFGLTGDPYDDCAYLEMSNPGGGVSVHDVRILRSFREGSVCYDKAPGSLVVSEDAAELFSGTNLRIIPMTLKYVDGNTNGNYDDSDALYLDADGSPGLKPTSSSGSQVTPTIRLTPAGDLPAGTLVFSNHPDYYGTGQGAVPLATPSVTWLEKDANTLFGPADEAFLLPTAATGHPAGSTIPLGALRLEETQFGSQVKAGSSSTTSSSTTSSSASTTTPSSTSFTITYPSETTTSPPPPTSSSSAPSYPQGNPRTGPATSTKSSPAAAFAVAAGLAAALAMARRRLD